MHIYLSLSLYIYIYIYIYTHVRRRFLAGDSRACRMRPTDAAAEMERYWAQGGIAAGRWGDMPPESAQCSRSRASSVHSVRRREAI